MAQTWRSRFSIPLGVAAVAALPIGALGTKFGLWPFTVGFLLIAIGVLLALTLILLAVIFAFMQAYQEDKKGLLVGGGLGLLPLAVVVSLVMGGGTKVPPIHNVTTDVANPPSFEALLVARGNDSNPVDLDEESQQANLGFYKLQPIQSKLSVEDAAARAQTVAEQLGWTITAGQRANYIEATDETFWFGFKDDVAIRITPTAAGSQVDLHSVSRVGKSDLGANALRIQAFAQAF